MSFPIGSLFADGGAAPLASRTLARDPVTGAYYSPVADWRVASWGPNFEPDADLYCTLDVLQDPTETVQLFVRAGGAGRTENGVQLALYRGSGGPDVWKLFDRSGYVDTQLGDEVHSPTLVAGCSVGVRTFGSTVQAWFRPPGGSWQLVMERTSALPAVAAPVTLSTHSQTVRITDVGGGPLDGEPLLGSFPLTPVIDDFEGPAGPLGYGWGAFPGVNDPELDGNGLMFPTPVTPEYQGAFRTDVETSRAEVWSEVGWNSDITLWALLQDPATLGNMTGYRIYARTSDETGLSLAIGKRVDWVFTDIESVFITGVNNENYNRIGLRVFEGVLQLWYSLGTEGEWTLGAQVEDDDITEPGTIAVEFWANASAGFYSFGGGDITPEPEPQPEEPPKEPVSPSWPVASIERVPPAWTFVLCDEAGRERVEVDGASGGRLAYLRNAAAEVTFGLDLRDAAMYELVRVLRNGIPRLKCYQDGELRFNGHWWPQKDAAGGDEAGASALRFRSPFARYEMAYTDLGAAAYEVRNRDAGLIATDLLALVSYGLSSGVIEPTVNRDRRYESKQIAEAIVQLTEVQGGFDFVEEFVEGDADTLALFNVYAALGQDRTRTVMFEHGDGTLENVLGVTRELRFPVNYVRVIGEQGLYADAADAASMAKYGQFTKLITANDGTVDVATLQARADAELRPNLQRVVEFTPDSALSPQPWADYLIGDTVTTRAREGALVVDEEVQLNGFAIVLDDEGNEAAHEVVFEQDGEFLPDETGFPEEVGV